MYTINGNGKTLHVIQAYISFNYEEYTILMSIKTVVKIYKIDLITGINSV